IEEAEADEGVFVFHSGTARNGDGKLVTSGGRVMGVCARAKGLSEAIRKAKGAAAKISFDGKHHRTDIGARAMDLLLERTGSGLI
ncbi:MAG TPA: phosphoribosylglycinamide synthetase C domain-containing protein, partial [Thermoanaerobaculia bacterium]